MQALFGHGCFAEYLQSFNLLPSVKCWFCNYGSDDTKHTFSEYETWEERRGTLKTEVGDVTTENIINMMINDKSA